jgi:3-phenylpropionate/cinnamic acid dioxygenase small subunit
VTDALTLLQAKQAITELLFAYGYALDARDWDALRACFIAEVVGHYGDDPLYGYEAIEQMCRTTLDPLSVSQHLIGSVVVTVDPDSATNATSTCYLHAQHVRPGAEGGEQFIFAGRYLDRLTRTPDGWRIADRTLEAMWTAGNPGVIARPLRTLEETPADR